MLIRHCPHAGGVMPEKALPHPEAQWPFPQVSERFVRKVKPFQAQESDMDFFFFFIGIVSVICALTYIKKTSPNKHHDA